MEIKVGTRGSKLALTQTQWVINQLKAKHPEIEFVVKIIKTKGDLIQNIALDKIGDKGLFVKEIETQLLEGAIDLAVHSMKDMPSEVTTGLCFMKTPEREDRRDVLVLREGINDLSELREGAVIATGSKRRKYQLLQARPDLQIVPIRGNIDTRIRKIEEENLDGVVLAASGLKRIGLDHRIGYALPEEVMVPAPAQGALAIQVREEDAVVQEIVRSIESAADNLEVEAERAFLGGVNGSCNIPIGAYAHMKEGNLRICALLGDEEGKHLVRGEVRGAVDNEEEARALGFALAEKIQKERDHYEG